MATVDVDGSSLLTDSHLAVAWHECWWPRVHCTFPDIENITVDSADPSADVVFINKKAVRCRATNHRAMPGVRLPIQNEYRVIQRRYWVAAAVDLRWKTVNVVWLAAMNISANIFR